MTTKKFTFVELDDRIEKIPNAPGEMVLYPKQLMIWEVIGVCGMVIGLTPSLLVIFLVPELWMVYVAKAGLAVMLFGFIPGMVYRCASLIKGMLNWRKDFNAGLDFAFDHNQELVRWLIEFPKIELEERMQFVRDARIRITDKVGVLVGSLDKLGFVPALIVVVTQVQEFGDLGSLPAWRIMLAFFLILIYALLASTSFIRLRAQIYEMLLVRAINRMNNAASQA